MTTPYRTARWILILSILVFASAVLVQLLARAEPPERTHTVRKIVVQGALPPASDHPLLPALGLARRALERLEKVDGYTAVLVKRESIEGQLGKPQCMLLKVRHKPLSVYLKFLHPASLRGREVLYVENQNDGKLIVHLNGVLASRLGSASIDPHGYLAMQNQRYPITEVGIKKLCERLIERAERDVRLPTRTEASFTKRAKLQELELSRLDVTHVERHPSQLVSRAVIYFDPNNLLPIRYEGYGWPEEEGAEPPLLEEYTYLKVDLNAQLTPEDFQPSNPQYHF